jgi:competence protein ComEA
VPPRPGISGSGIPVGAALILFALSASTTRIEQAAAAAPKTAAAAPQAAEASPVARELKSLKAVCTRCHNLQMVMDTPKSLDEWQDTLQAMVDRGAHGTDSQFDDILDYLHRTMTMVNVNTADAGELAIVLDVPDAVANSIVERRTSKKFSDLNDLKSVSGIDAPALDAKARLIFF